jgi:uncharacterized protein (UPF0248 family)
MSTLKVILDLLSKFFGGTVEKPSPSDIANDQAVVYEANKVTFDLTQLHIPFTLPPKVWLTTVQNTNSMEPVIDFGNVAILLAGSDEANQKIMLDFIKVGDIVIREKDSKMVMHRIVKIGTDGKRYFKTRGDNNYASDGGVFRDDDIKYLLAGIIY